MQHSPQSHHVFPQQHVFSGAVAELDHVLRPRARPIQPLLGRDTAGELHSCNFTSSNRTDSMAAFDTTRMWQHARPSSAAVRLCSQGTPALRGHAHIHMQTFGDVRLHLHSPAVLLICITMALTV